MKRALQIILNIGGAATLIIVALHMVLGAASIPGAIPVNATLDSEDRFYAVIFGGFGVALIWVARDVVARGKTIHFLNALFFMGGLARLASWAAMGTPHPFFVAMTAVELILPPVLWWMQRRV